MLHTSRGSRRLAMLSIAAVLSTASCGNQSVVTPADAAQTALEAALGAWREGREPGALMSAEPPILVAESEWSNGRKLSDFRIVREEPSTGDRRFQVALRYAGSDAETEVLYVVIGTHPVSVFREDDYQRALNMDNNPVVRKRRAG